MKKTIFTLSTFFAIIVILNSCKKNEFEITHHYYHDYEAISKVLNIPSYPLNYEFEFPKYYNSVMRTFDKDKATLGRVLFYDKNLSKDRSVSCGSCHLQELAFTDGEVFSNGIENQKTDRNSIALGSVFSFNEYYGAVTSSRIPFFWDNRASSVEEQSELTFANSKEMGMNMDEVTDRVRAANYYTQLNQAAYGSLYISKENILESISIFVNSISSFSSPYDKELDKLFDQGVSFNNLKGVNMTGLTVNQNLGKDLFIENCSSCHGNINGRPGKTQGNNGLDLNYQDNGIGLQTLNPVDIGKFKIPTLRNIALTAPYMHDGRFADLNEVLDFYSTNIQNHANLSPELRENNLPKKFNFTATEKAALIEFFDSFTDQNTLTDERFADPFK